LGALQCAWHEDPVEHRRIVEAGVRRAVAEGARLLQELTLSPYFRSAPDVVDALETYGEDV
jgi:hypothetical protein